MSNQPKAHHQPEQFTRNKGRGRSSQGGRSNTKPQQKRSPPSSGAARPPVTSSQSPLVGPSGTPSVSAATKEVAKQPQTAYVPKNAPDVAVIGNGNGVVPSIVQPRPVAPVVVQGQQFPFNPLDNGVRRQVPPRTQSAPPSLAQQKNLPALYIPVKTQAAQAQPRALKINSAPYYPPSAQRVAVPPVTPQIVQHLVPPMGPPITPHPPAPISTTPVLRTAALVPPAALPPQPPHTTIPQALPQGQPPPVHHPIAGSHAPMIQPMIPIPLGGPRTIRPFAPRAAPHAVVPQPPMLPSYPPMPVSMGVPPQNLPQKRVTRRIPIIDPSTNQEVTIGSAAKDSSDSSGVVKASIPSDSHKEDITAAAKEAPLAGLPTRNDEPGKPSVPLQATASQDAEVTEEASMASPDAGVSHSASVIPTDIQQEVPQTTAPEIVTPAVSLPEVKSQDATHSEGVVATASVAAQTPPDTEASTESKLPAVGDTMPRTDEIAPVLGAEPEGKAQGTDATAEKRDDETAPPPEDVSKKVDGGDLKAATFDADSVHQEEEKPKEPPVTAVVSLGNGEKEVSPEVAAPLAGATEQEDEDDWEVKAEKELVLQRETSGQAGSLRDTAKPEKLYPEGYWSPSNPQGKRMYDRDFLLKFQPHCRDRPAGLLPMEVILDEKRSSPAASKGGPQWSRGQTSFARGRAGPIAPPPGLARNMSDPRMSQPMIPNRRTTGRLKSSKKLKSGKEFEPAAPQPALEPAEGVWVRPSKRKQTSDEETYGKVRNLLNKITPSKFETLSRKVIEIVQAKASSVELLRGIIGLIFDTALAEPGFCTMYANICSLLDKNIVIKTEIAAPNGKPQTFKRILLNKCQEEFELKPSTEEDLKNPEAKAELEAKQKRRMLGNIVFIGELYKEKMLTDKIMHECIFRRLLGEIKNPEGGDIEALCKLMTTIGKVLDQPKAKSYMDAYFQRMRAMSNSESIPSRLRCLLQDVIDLRANRWNPKQANAAAGPKGAERGAKVVPPPSIKKTTSAAGGRQPAATTQASKSTSAGGWETVGPRSRLHDAATKADQALPNVVLGPNSRMGTTGAGGAKGWKSSSQSTRKGDASAAPVRGNMFGLLADGSSPQPERGRKDKSSDAKAENRKERDRASSERDKRSSLSERDADRERGNDKEVAKDKGQDSGAEAEKEIELLVMEYLDTRDEEEALSCMRELESEEYYPKVVPHIVTLALDKKEDEREAMCHLLRHFFKQSLMSATQFEKGFDELLEALPDLRLDAPLAPKYVGYFLANGLLDEYLSPTYINVILKRLAPTGLGEIVAASLFNCIVDAEDFEYLRTLYEQNEYQILEFFKPSNRTDTFLGEWLAKHGLQRLFQTNDYEQALKEKLISNPTVDELLRWIEDKIPRDVWTDLTFVRKLLYLVLETTTAKHSPDTLAAEQEQLETYAPLFKKFFPEEIEQQTECLLEVQRYCFEKEFPKGLMGLVFRYLYDQELVDEDAFRAWENLAGPGKAEALEEVGGQLDWLRTAKQEDEEDEGRHG